MGRWGDLCRRRRPSVMGGTAAAVAVAYAWWATGVAPFTVLSYVVVAVPSVALVVAYGAGGCLAPNRSDVAEYYRRRARNASTTTALPWLAILAAVVVLEGIGLLFGGRSPTVPTLSTTVDHLLSAHWGRFVLCGVWLSVGWCPVGSLAARARTGAG